MKITDTVKIIKISLIDENTGREELLFEREDSKCHFHKEFEFNEHIISLRLDWDDVENGEPRLDADIWKKPKNKKNRLRKGEWHHTPKQYDAETGKMIYKFEFNDLKLLLSTKKTVGVTITSGAMIVDKVDVKKIEANKS